MVSLQDDDPMVHRLISDFWTCVPFDRQPARPWFPRFRALRGLLRFPLRHHRPILLFPAAICSVAPQFPRDSPRVTPQLTGDLLNAQARGPQDRDLLALFERQVPTRGLV